MATTYDYTTGLHPYAGAQKMLEDPEVKALRNIVDFTEHPMDASETDVAQVLAIPAGTIVLDVFMRMITAETADALCDLGYGGSVNQWGKNLNMDTTAGLIVPRTLYATATWDPASCPSYVAASGAVHISVDTTVVGASLGDVVEVSTNLDLTDVILTGSVTAEDTVTSLIFNPTGTAVDLGSMSLKIVVIKATRRNEPVYFATADTIDISSSIVNGDVNLDGAKVEIIALTLPVRN